MTDNILVDPHKSSLGMNANVAVLISYLGAAVFSMIPFFVYCLTFVVPLIIYLLEKDSQFVKFHALQACLLGIACSVLSLASYFLFDLTNILPIMTFLFGLLYVLLAVLCTIKAWTYECYKLPVIGGIAEKSALKAKQ